MSTRSFRRSSTCFCQRRSMAEESFWRVFSSEALKGCPNSLFHSLIALISSGASPRMTASS
ncbi:MAG: hypothetical protein IPN03_07655 [Holophagales bacterium]|nr:hypothetical protein [Holophagales bacterium]